MIIELRNNLLMVGGGVAVAVGTYLPWIQPNPNLASGAEIPMISYYGMNAGFEGFDFALLGAVALLTFLSGVGFQPSVSTVMTLVVGIGITVFSGYYMSGYGLVGFSATFVPALGWYLTLLGGVLLSVAGGVQVISVIHRVNPTVSSNV